MGRLSMRLSPKAIIFLSGMCFMVLFLVLGLNRIITSGDNALLDLLVLFVMIAASQSIDMRKKREAKKAI